jgi:hypothetical protein
MKQSQESSSTGAGRQIDANAKQSLNARSLIQESREPGSNVTVERDWHPAKQYAQSSSTEEGRQIDESATHLTNANSPMQVT